MGELLEPESKAGQSGPQLVPSVAVETPFGAHERVDARRRRVERRGEAVELGDARARRDHREVTGTETGGRRCELPEGLAEASGFGLREQPRGQQAGDPEAGEDDQRLADPVAYGVGARVDGR